MNCCHVTEIIFFFWYVFRFINFPKPSYWDTFSGFFSSYVNFFFLFVFFYSFYFSEIFAINFYFIVVVLKIKQLNFLFLNRGTYNGCNHILFFFCLSPTQIKKERRNTVIKRLKSNTRGSVFFLFQISLMSTRRHKENMIKMWVYLWEACV